MDIIYLCFVGNEGCRCKESLFVAPAGRSRPNPLIQNHILFQQQVIGALRESSRAKIAKPALPAGEESCPYLLWLYFIHVKKQKVAAE